MTVRNRSARKIVFSAAVCLLAVCLAFMLCACNSQSQSNDEPIVRSLYIFHKDYDAANQTIVVTVAFSGDVNNKLDGADTVWTSESYDDGIWYKVSKTHISLSPSTIFSAVDAHITQEERFKDGLTYNSLKVVLRYDTIYKSIKSDATVLRAGKYYLHSFYLDESLNNDVKTLTLRTQNSASWYGVLIASGVLFCGLCFGVFAITKGRLWRKRIKG